MLIQYFICHSISMKIIRAIIWVLVVSGVGVWIYKASTMFSLQDTFWTENVKTQVNEKIEDTKVQADVLINSGKQYIQSWVDHIVLSWQALLEEKKIEAQQYLMIQKQKLKLEAQTRLEAEAKKKIQWVFTGR